MSNPKLDKVEGQEAPATQCAACEKSRYEVRALIVVRGETAICDECVLLCLEILAEKRHELALQDAHERVGQARRQVYLAREMAGQPSKTT